MRSKVTASLRWQLGILLMFILGSFIWVFALAPIPQPQSYHAFSDTKMIFGIPNFFNVYSNIFFLIVGLLGIRFCIHQDFIGTKNAWLVFFVGVALVSVGSSYYHWNPNNETLVWDRTGLNSGNELFFSLKNFKYWSRKFV